jgi:acyl-CoA reductase-like NAD-dependent aldehyde dehydrogenase
MIFGSQQTVEQYAGNPRVQVHGPGFSKILLGDDVVDQWEEYLDVMVESVFANGGRSCINASGIWASRHTREIAAAIAERLGPVDVLPPDNAEAGLAAFTVPGSGAAIWKSIEGDLRQPGVSHLTAEYGERLVEHERCAWLRPVVAHCARPDAAIAAREYMFPFVTVVECPQKEMLRRIGPTLVATAITENDEWIDELGQETNIDRLNIGSIPTNRVNWLQPHEGNLIDFLFRSRAWQTTRQLAATA